MVTLCKSRLVVHRVLIFVTPILSIKGMNKFTLRGQEKVNTQ